MNSILDQIQKVRAQLTGPGAPYELGSIEIDGVPMPVYLKAHDTLAELISTGRQYGDREFMVYEGDRWSFDRFYAAVDSMASHLREALDVRQGDHVAIAMRNRPEWAVGFAAAASIGAVPAPLNSFGLHDELVSALQDVAPKVLLCDADRLQRIGGYLDKLGCPIIVAGEVPANAPASVLRFTDLLSRAPIREPVSLRPDDPGLILFTSGATSKAKGVLSTQRAVCQAICNINYIGAFAAMTSPGAVAAIMERGYAPAILNAVPLFHVSGLHAQLLSALQHGRRVVFMHRWDPVRAVDLIRDERITHFNGAPSMVMQLLAEPRFNDGVTTRSIGGVGFGGAGLPQRLIDEVQDRKDDLMSGVGFGLTETNGVGAAASGELFSYKPRSSGLLSPIIDARVIDSQGKVLRCGEQGEICLRGATVMLGYLGNPEATKQAMHEGWFRTGDIGYIDDEGFLYVVDRIKDVINRNGEKISASEIESCLLSHPDIVEAAVFAAPHEVTGEQVVAVIVAKPASGLSAAAIQSHVAGRLAGYKVPARVHVQVEALPRNPAGKVLKTILKTSYADAG